MAFTGCWCGHYNDQHEELAGSQELHEIYGRCLAKGRDVPSCTCKQFKPRSNLPEGTDIYRDDDMRPEEPLTGYHLAKIEKGVLGELSKVREELDELFDAEKQGAIIMQLCEAADLVGALRAWLGKHHPGISLPDLVHMADLTERAFRSGRRK